MDSEQSNHEQGEQDASAGMNAELKQSRRKFARNAAVGSAVLLTLGNRVAWGGNNGGNKVCVSQYAWESYVAGGRSSLAPADGLDDEIEQFKQHLDKSGKEPSLNERKGKYCIRKK